MRARGSTLPPMRRPTNITTNMPATPAMITMTTIINDLFHLGLTDAFCGFKAHRVSSLRRLKLDVSGYAFPLQLWPQVAAAGLRLTELPVRLIYNDPTRHFGGSLAHG